MLVFAKLHSTRLADPVVKKVTFGICCGSIYSKLNLFVFSFKLDTTYQHIQKQREFKFKSNVNLNHSIYLVKGWGKFLEWVSLNQTYYIADILKTSNSFTNIDNLTTSKASS